MMKFIYTAIVEIEAKSEEDARIELLELMDRHDIDWDVEKK